MESKDKVSFLVNDNEVFAYFPKISADFRGNKMSYAHIGQHSACSPEYAKESRKATPEEYEKLHKELLSIGYTLQII